MCKSYDISVSAGSGDGQLQLVTSDDVVDVKIVGVVAAIERRADDSL